ncbi:hypothetical protein [Cyclobacterium roseum]|uniref:hypothetical protein n=1 Tax=Cyclobacterium roseum TaxID=2666137 RepID=UPI0013913DB8|nr:hypothetical protein [Cyclobacterium roseum]
MENNRTNSGMIRERLTLVLVLLFCTFISVSEFTVGLDADSSPIDVRFDLSGDSSEEGSGEEETFIHTAIDAVVPFALVVIDQAYQLIYEISGEGNPHLAFEAGIGPTFNQLFEILFEHIISVNAP